MEKGFKSSFELAVIDLVRKKRGEKKLSQEQLAIELDLSRGFIGQVESPKHPSKYNLDHINKIAVVLECSPQDLIPKEVIV